MQKLLVMTTALSLALAPMGFAQSVDGTKFRTIEEGAWYHPVEPDNWIDYGAAAQQVYAVLSRIEAATGARNNPDQPDTIMAYGPGNWIYEFAAAGDAAMAQGDYQAAANYYHTASAPHTNDPHALAALDKANAAYTLAAKDGVGAFRVVEIAHEGASFKAFLHLPKGEGPFPILVMSNGSDKAKVTELGYYKTHLQPKGIALLTLDTPGMGDSRAYDVQDGVTDKLHAAAIEWAKAQPELDANNVFMQGISFGGNAAARIFLSRPELDLAGVVYTCGPIAQVFMAPAQAYDHFPEFTMDGVKTRLGLEPDATSEELAARIRVLSLSNQGLLEGDMIDTPLLALNTNDDPVAPLEEMDALLARASNAERVVFDEPGHCPPHDLREAIASAWIMQNLR